MRLEIEIVPDGYVATYRANNGGFYMGEPNVSLLHAIKSCEYGCRDHITNSGFENSVRFLNEVIQGM